MSSSSSVFGAHLYNENDDEIIEPAKDTFKIDDFTSSSDWERFIAQIESVIREWKLTSGPRQKRKRAVPTKNFRQMKTTLVFYGFEFLVTRFYRSEETSDAESGTCADDEESSTEDEFPETTTGPPNALVELMGSKEHEFPFRAHPVNYFFGLDEFVVLSPNGREDIDNETRANIALSSITIALHNTNCAVPFFVQIMEKSKAMFVGTFAGGGFRTSFEMAVMSKRPSHCNHLSGLLQVFKSKLSQPSLVLEVPSVRVTVRFTYHLEDWTCHAWTQAPPDLELFDISGGNVGFIDLGTLPFGSAKDPIQRLELSATWYDLQEEIITDNDVHSDLDPLEAPQWTVRVNMEEDPQCILSEYITEMTALTHHNETVRQLLGDLLDDEKNIEVDENLEKVPDAFRKLTGPSYTLSDIIRSGRSAAHKLRDGGPINEKLLSTILAFLFPDSSPHSQHPYPKELVSHIDLPSERYVNYRVGMSGIKSSPVDGLVWRLTIALAHCLHLLGGIRSVAHLMHEFMLEVRHRWENSVMLPGLPAGSPDHSYCLFHQKLQMINCCIERKILREKRGEEFVTQTSRTEDAEEDMEVDDSSEEFFDCDDEEKETVPIWNRKPEGRFRKIGKLKLLSTNECMYEPVCQEPAPMTEDQLAEQAEVMLQLGVDAEGSELRAKMQSASLLSDMESFKAANPGSVLADFVRWHSPRDWVDATNELSMRMKAPGNMWQQVWDNANPVPARRQKRLFDDTREAEKVLQYLSSLRPGEVGQLLMPNLLHSSVCRLIQENVGEDVPHSKEVIKEAISKLAHMSRILCKPEVQHYRLQRPDEPSDFAKRLALTTEVAQLIAITELRISQAFSLQAKFLRDLQSAAAESNEETTAQMTEFVRKLHRHPEVTVLGGARGPAGQLIRNMFREAQKAAHMMSDGDKIDVFPAPTSREFILRTKVARPLPYSKPSPQRMYCCLKHREFRMAGAFTVDKQFL